MTYEKVNVTRHIGFLVFFAYTNLDSECFVFSALRHRTPTELYVDKPDVNYTDL